MSGNSHVVDYPLEHPERAFTPKQQETILKLGGTWYGRIPKPLPRDLGMGTIDALHRKGVISFGRLTERGWCIARKLQELQGREKGS